MDILLLAVVAVLFVVLFQIIDERKRLAFINAKLKNKVDGLFLELQAAEKAAQMLASYQDECH